MLNAVDVFFLCIETRAEADGLAKNMDGNSSYDRYLAYRNASLQKANIDLLNAVKLYQSLITFVDQMRETFDDMEIKAKGFVDNPEYKEVEVRLKLVVAYSSDLEESFADECVHG